MSLAWVSILSRDAHIRSALSVRFKHGFLGRLQLDKISNIFNLTYPLRKESCHVKKNVAWNHAYLFKVWRTVMLKFVFVLISLLLGNGVWVDGWRDTFTGRSLTSNTKCITSNPTTGWRRKFNSQDQTHQCWHSFRGADTFHHILHRVSVWERTGHYKCNK